MVRPAGFEPASKAWKALILTRLDYGRSRRESTVRGCDLRVLIKWTKLGRSVEGSNHILITSLATPVCAYRSVEGFDPDGRSPLAPVFDGQWKAAILNNFLFQFLFRHLSPVSLSERIALSIFEWI